MKKIFALLLSVLITLQPAMAAKEKSFTDLEKNIEEVNIVVNQYKIMSAYSDQTFRGNNSIDRYTYSTILYKTIDLLNKKMEEIDQPKILYLESPDPTEYSGIPDLNKERAEYSKILVLLKLGLIRTYSDNTFNGDKTVDLIGFAIGMGRIMKIIYDDAPAVLKKKWKNEAPRQLINIKDIPLDSPVYTPLKLAIDNNLIDIKSNTNLTRPITRYEAADYTYRLINKLDELRKYIVFTRI